MTSTDIARPIARLVAFAVAGMAVASLIAIPAANAAPSAQIPAAAAFGPAVASGQVHDNALVGVSCTAWTQCMAVGTQAVGTAASFRPLAEQWNGTKWRVVTMPGPTMMPRTILTQISCRSGMECVAVGFHYAATKVRSADLAESWNGSKWQIIQTSDLSVAKSAYLNSVSCHISTGCIAVGGATNAAGKTSAVAEQWTGAAWKALPAPQPVGPGSAQFNGISCGRRYCMAVGAYIKSSGRVATFAERWDGSAWHLSGSLDTNEPANVLTSVSCYSATLCMAAGYWAAARQWPLTEEWTKGRWRLVAGASAADEQLTGISCPKAASCLAVGRAGLKPLTEAWSGTSWRVVPSPRITVQPGSELWGLSCKTQSVRCIAVGDTYQSGSAQAGHTLAEWWDGMHWQVMSTVNP